MSETSTHTGSENPNPTGYVIASHVVLGKEGESAEGFLGVDVALEIPPIGIFTMNVMTRDYYGGEYLDEKLRRSTEINDLSKLAQEVPLAEQCKPFILNDKVMTEATLRRLFDGKLVENNMIGSMSYDGDSVHEDSER